MKNAFLKLLLLLTILAAVLSACAAPGADQPTPTTNIPNPQPTDKPLPTEGSGPVVVPGDNSEVVFDDNDPMVAIQRYLYENFAIPPADVRVADKQEREWSDSCLGLGGPEEICMQVITPGFIVTVETSKGTYVFHTDSSMARFRIETSLGGSLPDRFDPVARFQWLLAGRLSIPFDQVQVVSKDPIDWPSPCLGVEEPGVMCAAVITPGYRITLSTPQGEVVINTNDDFSAYRFPQPLPGEDRPLLTWERSGGIAGICEHLVIAFDGAYQLTDCRSETLLYEGILDTVSYEQLISKVAAFGPTTWKLEPPAGSADMFLDSFTLNGYGSQVADTQNQESLNDYFSNLVVVIKSQPTTK